jgi:hypothetical protein
MERWSVGVLGSLDMGEADIADRSESREDKEGIALWAGAQAGSLW